MERDERAAFARRRRAALIAAASIAASVLAGPASGSASAAAADGFSVGAAKVEITPPPIADATAAPAAFASCPAIYDGPREWAFEEPYTDLDGSGSFNYTADAVAEPYCDANSNGRWDGMYLSGGVDDRAHTVHDPIDARATAFSSGGHTVVIASVVSQGLFENYTDAVRAQAQADRPGIDDIVVSANHNECSPDGLGIYGAPPVPDDVPVLGGAVGVNSSINDYYMAYLEKRTAKAAVDAYDALAPATINVGRFPLPEEIEIRLSNNFPTTDDDGEAAATDPIVRTLQAVGADGKPIATIMNLAVHNQEIGHSKALAGQISADWPGYFHDALERDLGGGLAMFLVADNGSEEDPSTVPAVSTDEHPECSDGCYAQAQATGEAFAAAVASRLDQQRPLGEGAVGIRREELMAPLENNLFKAAVAAGLFGARQTYLAGVPAGRLGNELRSYVSVVDVGPDLQLIANPGESFPALMVGSPWGIEDAGCPERPNPPAPVWHARADNRWPVGLADDMIGYELPAWAFSSLPGAFFYDGLPASCVNDFDDVDPAGHHHKLETEGAGPTASNMVAERLAALLDADPDPTARIRRGRYLYADGSLSRRPTRTVGEEGAGRSGSAVAIWLAEPGSDKLEPGSGRIVALEGTAAFGAQAVDETGRFMAFDGHEQGAEPDITTRGMASGDPADPTRRYYLDPYPALATKSPGIAKPAKPLCKDERPPRARPLRAASKLGRGHVKIGGKASDSGCRGDATTAPRKGSVRSVELTVARRIGGSRCRYLRPGGTFARARPCKRRRIWLPAKGTERWRLRIKFEHRLAPGHFRARARATDEAGNLRGGGGSPPLKLRLRGR